MSFILFIHCLMKVNALQRFYSATPPPQRPPTFLGKIIENLRDELSRNQKMKESLKEFRKDMEKLEKSEALQKAR